LLHASYLRMSKSEAEAYDRRRMRIGAISDRLAMVRQEHSEAKLSLFPSD